MGLVDSGVGLDTTKLADTINTSTSADTNTDHYLVRSVFTKRTLDIPKMSQNKFAKGTAV